MLQRAPTSSKAFSSKVRVLELIDFSGNKNTKMLENFL